MKKFLAAAALTVASMDLSGVMIDPGLYFLNNHPFGVVPGAGYGMRLDELVDVTAGNDVFTFDFEFPGTSMYMDYDGTSLHIYGSAYGGLRDGAGYDAGSPTLGFWDIDFTYALMDDVPGDDDLWALNPGTNSGTIARDDNSLSYSLTDVAGALGFSFRLGDEDDDLGHRGFQGISGWGWVAADGNPTGATQDFLFTAVAVPEPSTYIMLTAFLGFALWAKRRRREATS